MEGFQTRATSADLYPLHVLQRGNKTIAVVGEAALCALPMGGDGYTHRLVTSPTELEPFLVDLAAVEAPFKWCARVTCSVSRRLKQHCLFVKCLSHDLATFALLEGVPSDANAVEKLWGEVKHSVELWEDLSTGDGTETIHVHLMSVPEVQDAISYTLEDIPGPDAAAQASSPVTTRVHLGNSLSEIVAAVRQLFDQLIGGEAQNFTDTEVCWPACMLFPVNVHTRDDARRRAEHASLLLPYQGLLHHQDAIQAWTTWEDLRWQHRSNAAFDFRTNETWERHLVTSPHRELAPGLEPSISGGETFSICRPYDYYHYRVDGFRDDGWGCAYRSLQTVLSWFQHAGLMRAAIPSIRRIQEVLYQIDPDKANRKTFVGSRDWIGSFEIMLVLQHYVPALECTIKRLESGKDLDTDPSVQLLLTEHFRNPRAAPVMIGGSSYAHTILGVHINVHTMEALYLILDPHYSACPTHLKTAIKKRYIGWKEASKFFEAGSWYNLCIPRADVLDPR
ncbi:hypothetical protein JKF63_01967 [Porcisia hertigi]|uniref:UFSP1/2/DUB catalytic domain-containing protein n=1 Tax=Porcisia hertigi TaxID=2761500 RepID=A0A836HX65_9TRYP|nr:hypothetical protein JKF63_01967 [Porcisia hertigi]